ncbi:hypothetical protein JYB62_18660 [Algoriphagus lutimaris]|uniref:hypothetical protein n=1 Tax=Algoriphagus lutimaris TaxID=613197 RepID=UPI00196A6BD9|nr:hypothetical protein [Algoriphagus lutimaris]MBN3522033.1 hypothetical protein [Algoriphagus lutimaris]
MINFFRKLRQKILSENVSTFQPDKFVKYLIYAIGEILLVVIGILIALYINTSREDFLKDQYTKSVFEQIHKDLQNDRVKLVLDIENIETTNRFILDMLGNKIPDSFYASIDAITYDDPKIRPIRSLCTDFVAFLPNTKGYDLLKLLNNRDLVNDSLTNDIISYYSQLGTVLPEYNKVTVEVSKRNIQEYKQYDWFENWAIGTYDPDFIEYLKENKDNKKRMAEFYSYTSVNETYWKDLKRNTDELINRIERKLKTP